MSMFLYKCIYICRCAYVFGADNRDELAQYKYLDYYQMIICVRSNKIKMKNKTFQSKWNFILNPLANQIR